jgi:hypothetical protein
MLKFISDNYITKTPENHGNMYDQPFYIIEKVSNNAFNLEKRTHKKLYVPQLKAGSVEDVRIGREIVFEDFDDEGKEHSCIGLEAFIKTKMGGVPAYVFDNHNHAFAFWCLEKQEGNLRDGALLVHIDQHKDTRIPESFLSKTEAQNPEKVFAYTNTVLNVGNFIPAAQHIGLVREIIFLDSQYSLEEIRRRLGDGQIADAGMKNPAAGAPNAADAPNHIPTAVSRQIPLQSPQNLILDIDLDFFAPESDYIGNDLKLDVIKKLIPQASVITFATSPYFIDQKRAIGWLRRIAGSPGKGVECC